jgi:hypothetical protein
MQPSSHLACTSQAETHVLFLDGVHRGHGTALCGPACAPSPWPFWTFHPLTGSDAFDSVRRIRKAVARTEAVGRLDDDDAFEEPWDPRRTLHDDITRASADSATP